MDPIALGLLGLPCAYLANEQILDPIAPGLLGLPEAYLANEQILGSHGSGPPGPTLGLPCHRASPGIPFIWAYWAYLGAVFANQLIL